MCVDLISESHSFHPPCHYAMQCNATQCIGDSPLASIGWLRDWCILVDDVGWAIGFSIRIPSATDHRYRLKASGSAPAPVPGPSSTSTSSHVTPDRSSLSSTVWCLLIRHTRTKEDNEDFIALHSFNSYGGEGGNERSTLKVIFQVL